MARPKGYNTYENTGWPAACRVWYSTSGGLVTGADLDGNGKPGAGKHIYVLGLSSINAVSIRPDSVSGGVMAQFDGAGESALNFPGAIDMGEDTAVFTESNDDVTLFYHIFDATID